MAGVPNQVSSAPLRRITIVVVVGRSVSLHRQQIKDWLARRRAIRQAWKPIAIKEKYMTIQSIKKLP